MERTPFSCAGVLFALCSLLAAGAPPAGAQESLETQLEMDAALAAERQPASNAAPVPAGELGAGGPLFVGVDDAAMPAYRIDPTIPASTPVPLGVEIWGAAYDPGSDTVYIISGSVLNSWVVGAPAVTPIGTITDANGGATLSMVAAAFTNGTLYSTRNIGTEGLYSINTATAVATLVAVPNVPTANVDFGGLAADPATGVIYATNDDVTSPPGRGLVTFALDGTVTFVAPYPAGETDIDGLAIGTDGKAYLVEDDSIAASGNIHVYNLTSGVYETPIPTPWTTSEVFSAGAWIEAGLAADLSITKTDGLTTASPGQAISYTIVASNLGPSDAVGATVTDTFPAALTGVTWTCAGAGGGTCTAAGAGDIDDVVSLPNGASVTYTVSATIDGAFLGTLSNTATVTPPDSVSDPVPGNNSDTDTTEVAGGANVSGTKTVSGDFTEGGTIFYEVVLTNTGDFAQGDNAGDEFSDLLPAELTLVGATATSGTPVANVGTNTVTWNGSIPVAGSVTITIEAVIEPGTEGATVSNQGTIAFDGDGDGSNESAGVTDDPSAGGATDPTDFVVLGVEPPVVEIPTASEVGLAVLALLLALAAVSASRRRRSEG